MLGFMRIRTYIPVIVDKISKKYFVVVSSIAIICRREELICLTLLMGFFVYKNRLLFTACMLLSYTLDYIAFSVVVKKCKPLIRPFIRSLRICPKSVNRYIFALFIILCNVIIKPSLKWQLVVSALSPSDTTRDCRLNWTTRWPVTN